MCNTSKKSSEKSSVNSEIIFEGIFIRNEKKHFFIFSILKILGFWSFEVNFLKSVGKKSKNYFTRPSMRS